MVASGDRACVPYCPACSLPAPVLIHFFPLPEMKSNPNLVAVREIHRALVPLLVVPADVFCLFFSFEQTFTDFQSKQSVRSSGCTGDCIAKTICYMRSGSASIAIHNCHSARV